MHSKGRLGFIGLFLLLGSANHSLTLAAERQSLASIISQAEHFIQNFPYTTPYLPQYEIGHIDHRLHLQACPAPLKIAFARYDKTHGHTAINLSCPQTFFWKLHLPVRIDLFDDILVAVHPLRKGQKIDPGDVVLQRQNISPLMKGYYTQVSEAVGLEAKRHLRPGTILTPDHLRPQQLVKSGQLVTIIFDYQGLQVKSTGLALQSAHQGEVIKVRNNQSQKVVEGIVSGRALIRVTL